MASYQVTHCGFPELNGSCEIDNNNCSSYTCSLGTVQQPPNMGNGSTLKFRLGFNLGPGRVYVITATPNGTGYIGGVKDSMDDDSDVEEPWAATSVTVQPVAAAKGTS